MNPNRFSLPSTDRIPDTSSFVPQAFMAIPACVMVGSASLANYQSQLYAWAFAQAQATQNPPARRTQELFGIFN
jgi:hypothetical protein